MSRRREIRAVNRYPILGEHENISPVPFAEEVEIQSCLVARRAY